MAVSGVMKFYVTSNAGIEFDHAYNSVKKLDHAYISVTELDYAYKAVLDFHQANNTQTWSLICLKMAVKELCAILTVFFSTLTHIPLHKNHTLLVFFFLLYYFAACILFYSTTFCYFINTWLFFLYGFCCH